MIPLLGLEADPSSCSNARYILSRYSCGKGACDVGTALKLLQSFSLREQAPHAVMVELFIALEQ